MEKIKSSKRRKMYGMSGVCKSLFNKFLQRI